MSQNSRRSPEIDFIRGVALLGIFLMNIDFISKSNLVDNWDANFINWFDHSAGKLKFLTLAQRFIGIFSLLFGFSIAIQKQNLKNNYKAFNSYYAKRIHVLSGLGIIQILFFFMGDILLIYGLLTILLIMFFNASDKIILPAAFLIFFIPAVLESLQLLPDLSEGINAYYDSQSITEIYRSGCLISMMKARLTEYFYYDLTGITWCRTSFAMMLAGYWIGRNNYQNTFLQHLSKVKTTFYIGLAFYFSFILYFFFFNASFSFWLNILYNIHILISIFVYSIALLYLYNKISSRVTILFVNLGRTSLSNYILQSVLCAFIFTGYGLGMFAKTTPTQNLFIVLSIYMFQITLTYFYLKKFNKGPLELLSRGQIAK